MGKEAVVEHGRIFRAKESFVHDWKGAPRQFRHGTTVREGHEILDGIEHLFEPLTADYELEGLKPDYEVKAPRPEYESATAGPNEKRGA